MNARFEPRIRLHSSFPRFGLRIRLAVIFVGMAIGLDAATARAAVYASFDASTQSRFLSGGSPNPNFYFDESEIRGIAVDLIGTSANEGRATLITPRHYITADHAPAVRARFRTAGGTFETYETTGFTRLTTDVPPSDDGPGGTFTNDFRIYTLDRDVDFATTGIKPLALLDASSESALGGLIGQPLVVYDQAENAGRNIIDELVLAEFANTAPRPTITVRYLYETGAGSLSDEAGLTGGDSGRPGLLDFGGTPVLIGTHFGIDTRASQGYSFPNGPYPSFTTLVTPYLDQIEAHVSSPAQGGFSINRITVPGVTTVPEPTFAPVAAVIGLIGWRRRRAAA